MQKGDFMSDEFLEEVKSSDSVIIRFSNEIERQAREIACFNGCMTKKNVGSLGTSVIKPRILRCERARVAARSHLKNICRYTRKDLHVFQ
jgi:hypothetical protein